MAERLSKNSDLDPRRKRGFGRAIIAKIDRLGDWLIGPSRNDFDHEGFYEVTSSDWPARGNPELELTPDELREVIEEVSTSTTDKQRFED